MLILLIYLHNNTYIPEQTLNCLKSTIETLKEG